MKLPLANNQKHAFQRKLSSFYLHTVELSNRLTIKQLKSDRIVHVLPPVFSISGDRNLPVGPLTSQMDANAGNHRGLVLEAKCSEVEAA